MADNGQGWARPKAGTTSASLTWCNGSWTIFCFSQAKSREAGLKVEQLGHKAVFKWDTSIAAVLPAKPQC